MFLKKDFVEKEGLPNLDIKFPVKFEHDELSLNSIIAALYPTFSYLIRNRKYYLEEDKTDFSVYEEILNKSLTRKEASLCERSDAIFFYELKAISLILGKEVMSEESMFYKCN